MSQTRRVVFDTSALIGAVLRPDSVPRQAFMLAVGAHELCVSVATLQELQTVLQRPKFDAYAAPQERQEFLALYIERARLWTVDESSERRAAGGCRDPKDDKFLALALACQAATLVSSDEDLLVLGTWNDVAIVTPATFLATRQG